MLTDKGQKAAGLQENNRVRGASLPMVICVGAFLLAFSLALVYTAGLLLAGTDKKTEQERCYQLASSFAKEIERDLKKEGSSFQRYANKFLENKEYHDYNPENPATVYHYLLSEDKRTDSRYGNIKLHLYKESNEGEEIIEGEESIFEGSLPTVDENSSFTDIVNNYKTKSFQRYIFTIEVIAEKGNLSYNYATEYFREDKYNISFSHAGNDIVWDEAAGCWRMGNNIAGDEYTGWKESKEPIRFKYLTDKPVSWKYRNVHEEAGSGENAVTQGGGLE